jgi:Flp pilus assembly protein TadG
MASLNPRARRCEDDSGSELIEFAIVLPILLLVFAAMIDFGFLFQRYEVVTNAAREGARVAVLPGYSTADVQNRVNSYLAASGLTAVATVNTTFVPQTVQPSGLIINTAQVVVQYPSQFAFIGPFAGFFGGSGWGSITLQAQSIMRVEGGS